MSPARPRRTVSAAVLAATAVLTGLLTGGLPTAAAQEPAPRAVDRFEGEVPFASPPAEGLFTWGTPPSPTRSWN